MRPSLRSVAVVGLVGIWIGGCDSETEGPDATPGDAGVRDAGPGEVGFVIAGIKEIDGAPVGDTLVLDDGGRFDVNSAPAFEDFDRVIECDSIGNTSMIFNNNGHSWHGVRAIDCPEGHMRKVFIVVINPDTLFWKVRDKLIGKSIQRF